MPPLRLILAFVVLCLFYIQADAQFFDSLSRPSLWIRPDQGVINTNQWTDISGNGNHALFVPPLSALANATINYHKTVQLNGADQLLEAPVNMEELAELAILCVFQSTDTLERTIWRTINADTRKIDLSTRRASGPDLITDIYGKYENAAYLNTVSQSWDKSTPSATIGAFEIGGADMASGKRMFKGSIAELMIFKRALTFLERAQIETYLAIKYGVSVQGHNYVSSSQKVLWHTERNAAYTRIAGIGRDDAFSLNQKQSASAYDSGMVVMSLGSIAATNAQNTSTLQNENFVLWGDNGKPLRLTPGTGSDSVLSITERRWRVSANGNEIKQRSVSVHIDISRLQQIESGYWLVIDRSGTGNFNIDNLEYVLASNTAGGKATFNVVWDNDGSGQDDFAIAGAKTFFAIARTLKNPLCTDETAGEVSIEVIAGEGPFQYTLSNTKNDLEREGRITAKTKTESALTAGDYTLVMRDADGLVLNRNFNLIMPDALYIDAGEDQRLTDASEIILDASSSVPDSIAVSYLWQNNFGFSSDETAIRVTESGIYRVTVTKESDGCAFTDEVVISGAEEQRLAVYPTVVRSNSSFTISASLPQAGNVQVVINNTQGHPIMTFSGTDQLEYQFNASINTAGLYVVVIQTPMGIESRKVIVQ